MTSVDRVLLRAIENVEDKVDSISTGGSGSSSSGTITKHMHDISDITNLQLKLDSIDNMKVNTASKTVKGVVQVGDNINVDSNGVISVTFPTSTTITDGTTVTNVITHDESGNVALSGKLTVSSNNGISTTTLTASDVITVNGNIVHNNTNLYDTNGKINTSLLPETTTTSSGNGLNLQTDWINNIKWTKTALTGNITDMAYGNGVYVCVNKSSVAQIYYSRDAVNWSLATLPEWATTNKCCFCSVAFGNNIFIACGTAGAFYSSDGIVWTLSKIASVKCSRVIYGLGKFVIITSNVKWVIYTTDGTTMKQINVSEIFKDICCGDDNYVAISSTAVYYSTDLESWTKVEKYNITQYLYGEAVNGTSFSSLTKVVYGSCKGVTSKAGNQYYLIDNTKIITSSDGKTWSTLGVYTRVTVSDIIDFKYIAGSLFVISESSPFVQYNVGETFPIEENSSYKGIFMLNKKLFVTGNTGFILSCQPLTDDILKLLDFEYNIGGIYLTGNLKDDPNFRFPGTEWTLIYHGYIDSNDASTAIYYYKRKA